MLDAITVSPLASVSLSPGWNAMKPSSATVMVSSTATGSAFGSAVTMTSTVASEVSPDGSCTM